MSNRIITVSREFGCGARQIVNKLSKELQIELHDKDLIDETVKKTGIQISNMNEYDEKIPDNHKSLWYGFGYGSSMGFLSEQAIEAQAEIIRELADKNEDSIFFGRCADYILQENKKVIHFFLYASLDFRINYIMNKYGISEKESTKMIKRIDRQRHNYYKYVTGKSRGDRDTKNVMIDVGKYGIDKSVEVMKKALEIYWE